MPPMAVGLQFVFRMAGGGGEIDPRAAPALCNPEPKLSRAESSE
jgi:hypothetical protein